MSARVLGRFEEKNGTGETLRYRVQTVEAEHIPDIIDQLQKYFLTREPFSAYFELAKDPDCVACIRSIWKEVLLKGAALVAIGEEPAEYKDKVLGANVTFVAHKDDKLPKVDIPHLQKFFDCVLNLCARADIFETFDVVSYLSSFGLSVAPEYKGFKIGQRILECREPLCRQLGIKVIGTIFTAPASQHISKKIGYKTIFEEKFSDYVYEGEHCFKDLVGTMTYSVKVCT